MPNTITTLVKMGYEAGIAHGSVEAEQQASEEAQANAAPAAIAEQARDVTATTIQDLANAGKLPDTAQERRELAAAIADNVLENLTVHANAQVDFHQRALKIAMAMPDVWVVNGPGLANLYVACKPDGTGWDDDQQAVLDALCDPNGHKERCFQQFAPDEVVRLAFEARDYGADVEGDCTDTGKWTLAIDGKQAGSERNLEAVVAALRKAQP